MQLREWFNHEIPIMGFGGIPIMSGKESDFLVELKNIEYDESIGVIKEAINMGIKFFDTALDYGDSEEKIGKAIKGHRHDVVLASKSKALTYDDMMRSVEQSMQRLDVEYIDLYQLHFVKDPTSYHIIMGENGAYEALKRLKTENVIREIGIASHNSMVLSEAMSDNAFYSMQLPYNLIENENIQIVERAKEYGIKTIIMKPFAGGSLTRVHPRLSGYIKSDIQLRELSLQYIVKEAVDMIIPGMSSLKELKENWSILSMSAPYTDTGEILQKRIIQEIGTTFCRRCQYCEPCPQGLEIAKILRFGKYYEDYNLKEWAKKQYKALTVKADSCIKCHNCESKCPYNLNIVERISEIRKEMED